MVYWLATQDHTGAARGKAPFCERPEDYTVYRNAVTDNGALNDGTGDQTWSLQCAINEQYKTGDRGNRYQGPTVCQPRVVFLPSGTYQIKSKLDLRLGTVLVGDPTNPPTIKAAPDFQGGTIINGNDYATNNSYGTTNFMILMKNIIIDTTAVPNQQVLAIDWSVAQGCGLTNVSINMPSGQQNSNTGHTGIFLSCGSTITVTDVNITGGFVGINFASQQAAFKGINFKWCTTGLIVTGSSKTALVQKATFDTVGLCTDISSAWTLGSFTLLDCTVINSGPAVKLAESRQVAIQNLSVSGNDNNQHPVAVNDQSPSTALLPAANHIDTWIWGNVAPGGFQRGMFCSTTPPTALLGSDGKFFTRAQPTYADATPDQIVNVKSVPGNPVAGDGVQDDTTALNAILAANAAANKITYFPSGVYLVTSTLHIPPGTRIVGEAWPTISGSSTSRSDPSNPVPIVQIGQPSGETGTCEISEMRFDVATLLPGGKILEVNMAGTTPGDVGIWNSVVTVGGTRDCQFSSHVGDQDVSSSRAAFVTLHLTRTSSAYVENFWSWTADHYLDWTAALGGGGPQIISTGRGLLCEATRATWLAGTGFEHHWLYQYNFHGAANVFAGLLQTETPYMQGAGAVNTVPSPWTPDPSVGDPDFAWADPQDQTTRVALAVNVDGGRDLYLYNGAHWAFFTGPWNEDKFSPGAAGHSVQWVQTAMVRVANAPERLVYYGVNTKAAYKIVDDEHGGVSQEGNAGGWNDDNSGGQLMAYRTYA